MIERDISDYIRRISAQFSVISIVGPRQSGKTTLAKALFPNYNYVNFEWQSTYDEVSRDLESFMRMHPAPLIIDEAQCYPKILSNIQVWVDEHPEQKAAYVITGSNQPHLRGAVSQSLAGRVAMAYLLPLSISELKDKGPQDRVQAVCRGYLPRLYAENIQSELVYENYLTTYIERDVNQLIGLKDLSRFTILLRLLAARVGQLLNYESLANEVGVSAVTIKDWISVMEASFIVFRLYPYYRNFGKRFVKTPKLYFSDVGLATYLLNLTTAEQVERDPLFGSLFENMVVADVRKDRLNHGNIQGGSAGMYFLRDNTGNEIDLVLEDGRQIDLVEIKSGMSFNVDYAKSIEKYARIIPEFNHGSVVYAGAPALYHDIRFVNYSGRNCN